MDIEVTGTYPIIIDGRETGEVNVTRKGLFWCFNARSEMLEGIIRLSVFGDGGEGYLGVMSPENDALTLHKKLSRSALKTFPKSIDHCSKKGEPQYPAKNQETVAASEVPVREVPAPEVSVPEETVSDLDSATSTSEPTSHSEDNEASVPLSEEDDEVPEDAPPQEVETPPPIREHPPPVQIMQPKWRPCVLPCSLFSDIEAKSAFGEIRGALVSNDKDFTQLAVPLSAVDAIGKKSVFYFDRSEEIDGTRYVICKIKNGKIYGAS